MSDDNKERTYKTPMGKESLNEIAATQLSKAREKQASPIESKHDNAIVSIAASLCRIADGIEDRNEQMGRHIDLIERETEKRAKIVDGHLDNVEETIESFENVVAAALNVVEAFDDSPDIWRWPNAFEQKIRVLELTIDKAIEVIDR